MASIISKEHFISICSITIMVINTAPVTTVVGILGKTINNGIEGFSLLRCLVESVVVYDVHDHHIYSIEPYIIQLMK